MAHENIDKVEKIAELGNNISLWRVHLDAIREQDKNARVMPLEKFDRLTANIAKDHRLESLPLVTPIKNQAGNPEFLLISGHHRTRAARAAGVQFIHVLSLDEELTHDQIRAKQLAHNALSGYDDPDVLAELYAEIQNMDEKLASGLTDLDFQIEAPTINSGDVEVNFDFEVLSILFMPKQARRFEEILSTIDQESTIYLADKADFERMKAQIQEISKRENVRNMSAIMARMLDIVEQYHKQYPAPVVAEENKPEKKNGKHKGKEEEAN